MDCLARWTAGNKRAPKLAELAAWCKKSPTAVYSALVSLEHKGHVGRVGGVGRASKRFRVIERG